MTTSTSSSPYRTNAFTTPEPVVGKFAGKVYSWMTGMLLATAGISFASIHLGANQWFMQNSWVFMALLIVELILVGMFAGFRDRLNFAKGLGLVGAYTALNGLTLSVILSSYHISTIGVAFMASAGVFGLATLYGFIGKSLAKIGGWLLMGVVALIAALITNMFLGSQLFDYILSCVTVLLFTGLAAYDAQVIRARASSSPTNLDALDCALEIYLDFLNIFLAILRLFGVKTKND